jgi:predicted DCC family thiol-disulfide oxidoreductase YuxK
MPISVFTETTEENAAPSRGWVVYNGECQFCLGWVRRMKPVLEPRGFLFLPLQTPWVRAFFRVPVDELLSEMRVITNSGLDGCDEHTGGRGQVFGGADAIVELAKRVWWAWPLVALAKIPGAQKLLGIGYRAMAARRYCAKGRCTLPQLGSSQNTNTQKGGIRI